MQTDWEHIAHQRGYPSMKALLIHKYVLEGRQTGWLASLLKCTRWTIMNLLRQRDIPLRGPRVVVLPAYERQLWETRLRLEGYENDGVGEGKVSSVE
jgi:hypothetical protein